MRGPGRPPYVAGGTPLQAHLLPLDRDSHVASRSPQIPRGSVVRVCSEATPSDKEIREKWNGE